MTSVISNPPEQHTSTAHQMRLPFRFQSVANKSFTITKLPCYIGRRSQCQSDSMCEKYGFTDCPSVQVFLVINKVRAEKHLKLSINDDTVYIEVFTPLQIDKTRTQAGERIACRRNLLVNFPCQTCPIPHVFHIKEIESQQHQLYSIVHNYPFKRKTKPYFGYFTDRMPKVNLNGVVNGRDEIQLKVLETTFGQNQREALKRAVLLFGCSRLDKIQKTSETLAKVSKTTLEAQLKQFLIMLLEQVPADNDDIKTFLQSKVKIEERTDDCDLKFWGGERIQVMLVQWARRIIMLETLKTLIEDYKVQKTEYLAKPDQDPQLTQLYMSRDNLVQFAQEQLLFYKPTPWWQVCHDVDLLWGVYKYGFGNYQIIKDDHRFSWYEVDKPWPQPERITKRLKKLLEVSKSKDRNFNIIQAEQHSGLSVDHKIEVIVQLTDRGLNYDSQNPYAQLIEDVARITKEPLTIQPKMMEQFCDRVQMESSRMVREYNKNLTLTDLNEINIFTVPKMKNLPLLEKHPALLDMKWMPDGDDIGFRINSAFKILKRTLFFSFIKKNVLANQGEGFLLAGEAIKEAHAKVAEHFVVGWKCPDHDLALLMAIKDRGIDFLKEIKREEHYQMQNLKVSKSKLIKRADWVAQVIKRFLDLRQQLPSNNLTADSQNFSSSTPVARNKPTPKQNPTETAEKAKQTLSNQIDIQKKPRAFIPKDGKVYKVTPIKIEYSNSGKIKCPVQIGLNLIVLDFGRIDQRSAFHSTSNIYPIGFRSIRIHQSAITLGGRCNYTNEIYEVDGKPMFKTTSEEDPDNPIIKDNCSGIWCEIIKKINSVTQARVGDKISISGPQMFGIAEYQVQKIFQEMPGASKLVNYQQKVFITQ